MGNHAQQSSLVAFPIVLVMDIITTNNKLYTLIQPIPKHNLLVFTGDRNAQISNDGNSKFCLLISPNRNGEYVVVFSWEQVCMSKP